MSKSTCIICGETNSITSFCEKHMLAIAKGHIVHCEVCDLWTFKEDGCMCTEQQSDKSNEKRPLNHFSKDDPRKKWNAPYLCEDGHYVRSRAEMIIDNWLYNHRIIHAYEISVFFPNAMDENALCDFYLPVENAYIEFWGMDKESYKANKERKIELYTSNDIKLINIDDDSVKRLSDYLPRELYRVRNSKT